MPRVIVFETQPYWLPELQRRFLNESVEVGACRSVRDLESRTQQNSTDVVILDLAADVSGSLRWLARHDEWSARIPVIVVVGEEHTVLDWRIREMGAMAVVDEFVGGHRMAAVCRKAWHHSLGTHSADRPPV